ncbi:Probable low-specificity L-threonine aldolase [Seminavis robusta]|uniref:Probable low-specificity L-threonine aldolase n=1 Tax=Seminavis robusta TaxID=568900 RepID=A0A9N8E351_9STRA|nr:Probable low-specificity L-threonine aldolase [Seminavis robusta]|eukprot:Sro496_g154620.1 Probable low-specificity L-threonine aldolase (396) ;mRNA; r:37091-38278
MRLNALPRLLCRLTGCNRSSPGAVHYSKTTSSSRRCFSSSSSVVDLRSDTVTAPSRPMLEAALTAPTGDDVMGEDPTVIQLQEYMADLAGKEAGLYVPTGTMANLVSIMAHCHTRAGEIIIGANSHISLWEAGNAASLAGVHTRQLPETPDGVLRHDDIRDAFRLDTDDHCAKTALICLENTHNMLGGAVLNPDDIHATGKLAHDELGIQLHIDGARIFNAVVASQQSLQNICQHVDSVSICLSKGLGAPLGSVLVGDKEFIRLAKRARKRCGGGMRQAGVVAAMGLYAVQNNVERLEQDHIRAKRLGAELHSNGFFLPRNGQVDTNLIFFGLPPDSKVSREELIPRLLKEYGIKLSGGYSRGGELFRLCTHMDLNDEGVDRAAEAIVSLCCGRP